MCDDGVIDFSIKSKLPAVIDQEAQESGVLFDDEGSCCESESGVKQETVKCKETTTEEETKAWSSRKKGATYNGTNKYGRDFMNGRPLPEPIRKQIIDMFNAGGRPCDISRCLGVSHGCVSKILGKYRKTGTLNPGQIGGSRAKVTLPAVVDRILELKKENELYAWQIRDKLIKEGLCTESNCPSISSINRVNRSPAKKRSSVLQQSTSYTPDTPIHTPFNLPPLPLHSSPTPDTKRNLFPQANPGSNIVTNPQVHSPIQQQVSQEPEGYESAKRQIVEETFDATKGVKRRREYGKQRTETIATLVHKAHLSSQQRIQQFATSSTSVPGNQSLSVATTPKQGVVHPFVHSSSQPVAMTTNNSETQVPPPTVPNLVFLGENYPLRRIDDGKFRLEDPESLFDMLQTIFKNRLAAGSK